MHTYKSVHTCYNSNSGEELMNLRGGDMEGAGVGGEEQV